MDDTQLYLNIPQDPKVGVELMNWCLERVMGWIAVKKLRLNPDKLEILVVGSSSLLGVVCHPGAFQLLLVCCAPFYLFIY